jgi:DNA-binding transcriptional MerR regulator
MSQSPERRQRQRFDGAPSAEPRQEPSVSIGEVLALLQQEFPDISVSKIRFLESEGLVRPLRTPSGYRRFRDADIERLRTVLTLQRDHYLPLKVIREHLEATSQGTQSPAFQGNGLQSADFRPGAGRLRLDRAELADATGLPTDTVDDLVGIGLIAQTPLGTFDQEAFAICEIVSRLAEHGVEPRHLRSFRVVADRDAGLIDQMTGPHRVRGSAQDRLRAEELARELAALITSLHAAVLRSELVREAPVEGLR